MAAVAEAVADMEEVGSAEGVAADEVVVSPNNPFSPVPSADGTNKAVGRRFHLF
jgi:hypothetical protein